MKKFIFILSIVSIIFACNKQPEKLPDAVDYYSNHDWDKKTKEVISLIEKSTTVDDAKKILIESSLSDKIIGSFFYFIFFTEIIILLFLSHLL